MKLDGRDSNNDAGLGIGILGFGVLIFIAGLIFFGPDDKRANYRQPNDTVYYNIPIYTTVYEIVYPDSTYRYTCTSHLKMHLGSYRGTNSLRPDYPIAWHRNKPDWWDDNWEEPSISTTAPIRIVSESVSYKKTKYTKRR